MRSRIAFALALALSVACAGCAASGDYPSLARRPAEALYASGDPERVPVPAPDDVAIRARIDQLIDAGRAGDSAFAESVGRARELAARAGAAGSDSWVEAQQALSRAGAAQAATTNALADLDAFAVSRAAEGPLSPDDAERLAAATATLQALADRQHDQIEAIAERLKRR